MSYPKLGVDVKPVSITQGTTTVLLDYIEKADFKCQGHMIEYAYSGYTQDTTTNNKDLNSFFSQVVDTITNRNSNRGMKPRGVDVYKIGDSGFKISILAKLVGNTPDEAKITRNNIIKMYNSGQPCYIKYLTTQTYTTSGKLSTVNPDIRLNQGIYCKIVEQPTFMYDVKSQVYELVDIVFQEVPRKTQDNSLINKILNNNIIDKSFTILENIQVGTQFVATAIKSANLNIQQLIGAVVTVGDNLVSTSNELAFLSNNIVSLLSTPELLIGRFRDLSNEMLYSLGDYFNDKGVNRMIKSFATYSSPERDKNESLTHNGRVIENQENILHNHSNRKITLFYRCLGCNLLTHLLYNQEYNKVNDIFGSIDYLNNYYKDLCDIAKNNGLDYINNDILEAVKDNIEITIIQLKNKIREFEGLEIITSHETTITNLISQYYLDYVAGGYNIYDLSKKILTINNIDSYNAIIKAQTKITLPIL
jgi:hypothetical protein